MLRSCVNGPVVIPFPARAAPIRHAGIHLEIRTRAERLEVILRRAPAPQPVSDPRAALHRILASVLG